MTPREVSLISDDFNDYLSIKSGCRCTALARQELLLFAVKQTKFLNEPSLTCVREPTGNGWLHFVSLERQSGLLLEVREAIARNMRLRRKEDHEVILALSGILWAAALMEYDGLSIYAGRMVLHVPDKKTPPADDLETTGVTLQ